ncbi:MAG TPA: hypothetical protein VG940_11815 [Gemmatimonadales bacterium]|nr:hypothetical protein [Gemmatimonadales bacterium]
MILGRSHRLALLALLCAIALPRGAHAQTAGQAPTQAVSVNPFGILIEWFNVEYERVVAESYTVGVGGSTFKADGDRYSNLDAFWRFYPQAEPSPFQGWSFGLRAGVTGLDDKTYFGAGFDVNRSWLLGKNENFYVGAGFGLKRLWGHDDGIKIVPTIRIVNIGIAF